MYNDENREWINQQLFFYNGENFNGGNSGNIEIGLSTSTNDSKNFSPLKVLISVISNDRKVCSLNFNQIFELSKSINDLIQDEKLMEIYNNNQECSIDRKYSRRIFKLIFKKSQYTYENCVALLIANNETDKNLSVMKYQDFLGFFEILNRISNNFFWFENNLIENYFKNLQLSEIKSLNSTLKTIPKSIDEIQEKINNLQIIQNNHSNESRNEYRNEGNESKISNESRNEYRNEGIENEQNSTMETVQETTEQENDETHSELDQFLGNDFENIDTPELDHIEKQINQEETKENQDSTNIHIDSPFIEKVLEFDVNRLETIQNTIFTNESKVFGFANYIENECGQNPLNIFNNNQLKSIIYLSEIELEYNNKNYILNGVNFPQTCSLITEKVENKPEFNKNLSLDLLVLHAYLKSFRSQMENKISDPNFTKSHIQINTRLLTDCYTYSLLYNEDHEVVKNSAINRFNQFYKQGVFESYNKILNDYNCPEINSTNITKYIDAVLSKLPSLKTASETQDLMYQKGQIKIPSENKFSLEQIINEITKLEVPRLFSLELNDDNLKKFGIDKSKLSSEILNIFLENRQVKRKTKKQSNILRFVKYFDSEVPDSCKDEFFNYIENLGEDNFSFNDHNFPINEFGENIIKGLYIWNNSDKHQKYTDFFSTIENSILTKQNILAKEMSEEENNQEESNDNSWADNLDKINLK